MKRTALLFLVLFGFGFVCNCGAQAAQKIVLNDNSVIIGRVKEMKDNVYTIETSSFGEIKVPASKIVQIESQASSKNQQSIGILDGARQKSGLSLQNLGGLSSAQSQVDAQLQSMLLNEDFMQSIFNLSQNAEAMSVLQDEEVMRAIGEGDYESLLNNPKIQRFIETPEMQKIIGGFK